jgi:hypothetical protein
MEISTPCDDQGRSRAVQGQCKVKTIKLNQSSASHRSRPTFEGADEAGTIYASPSTRPFSAQRAENGVMASRNLVRARSSKSLKPPKVSVGFRADR